MPGSKTRSDIYQDVTDQLITLMEQGVKPWTPALAGWTWRRPRLQAFALYR